MPINLPEIPKQLLLEKVTNSAHPKWEDSADVYYVFRYKINTEYVCQLIGSTEGYHFQDTTVVNSAEYSYILIPEVNDVIGMKSESLNTLDRRVFNNFFNQATPANFEHQNIGTRCYF